MSKKLFVGGLAWGMTEDELREIFASFGDIEEAIIIIDREMNRSKGFGFVTFADDAAADAAIEALDGSEQMGRNIVVIEARPRD